MFLRRVFIAKNMSKVIVLLLLIPALAIGQTRLKDVASIQGFETNKVTGIGLVTGLNGTGDGTQIIFTIRAMANLLKNYGMTIDENRLRMRNAAVVTITAEVPGFAKRGNSFDLTVSSMGDASSLEGGVLTEAVLLDMRGQPIGVAQGPISIGGLNQQGAGVQNFTAAGRIVKGGTLLKDVPMTFESENVVRLNLNDPDFTTAFRIAESINATFGANTAHAIDPGTVEIKLLTPYNDNNRQVEFISLIEQLKVTTDVQAKVVINERTGTVIVGADVRLSEVLITHGNLTINIAPAGAQPPAGGQAQQGQVVFLNESIGSSIGDLATALNALQVTPKDMIAIFQALKAQGALKADLVIM